MRSMSDRINQKTKLEITQAVFRLASVPSEKFTLCILMPMRKAFRLFYETPLNQIFHISFFLNFAVEDVLFAGPSAGHMFTG